MKSIKKKPSKKILMIIPSMLLFAAIVTGALYATNTYPFEDSLDESTINLDEPSNEQKQQGEDTKQDIIDSENNNSDSSSEQNISKEEGSSSETPSTNKLETIITVLEADEKTLYVRSETQGIYAEGSCTLTLTKSGKTITKNASVQALPQTTTCKGFNIPRSELSSGTYSVTLKVSAGGKNSVNKDEVSL